MCYGYNLRVHEKCSGNESTSKDYLCDFCKDKLKIIRNFPLRSWLSPRWMKNREH